MTALEVLSGLLLAGVVLYGLGLPIAWLLPVPAHSPWVLRIAVAPLYAIAACFGSAALLGRLGLGLDPRLLVLVIAGAWVVAGWRTRRDWRLGEAIGAAGPPAVMIALSGVTWALSLQGYGLYLPNQDFKNHAYFVAQIAWTGSTDPSLVLRPSPISAPELVDFYPLGLHTALGWVLPNADYPTVAITAAAAVLVTSISMPLALVAMARHWAEGDRVLSWMAGSAGVLFVGLSTGFRIGSVVLLVAAALYAAALAVLWHWVTRPSTWSLLALGLCGLGLLVLHVAEAVGLALVAVITLPIAWRNRPRGALAPGAALALAVLAAIAVAGTLPMLDRLLGLLDTDLAWDLQANLEDPVTALLVAAGQQPAGNGWGRALWAALALAGFTVAARRRWSAFPLLAFVVPLVVGALCGLGGLPAWLDVLTAPWYGSAGRVGLMAMAPVALAGSLALAALVEAGSKPSIRAAALVAAVGCASALAVQVVPARRVDLNHALAGAGDTAQIAGQLADLLLPGESVLTFDGDGTANLFAFARVPVTAGLDQDPAAADPLPPSGLPLEQQLLRLEDPAVRSRLAELGVAYIALGSARYWGEGPAYLLPRLLEQPQLSLALSGSDMVIMRYQDQAGS